MSKSGMQMPSLRMSPLQNAPALWRLALPFPQAEDHKYVRGAAVVWSGPEFRTGAARLTARAALQIGAGLVTIAGPEAALREHATQVTAIMLRRCECPGDWRTLLGDKRIRSLVVGPAAGTGRDTRKITTIALGTTAGVVLDADALTAFAGDSEALANRILPRAGATVLTPHEGEFAVLFPDLTGDRARRALDASRRSGAVVVLKGHHTLIAAPDGRLVENTNAPPSLATAGSGDVLAGLIGGLIAQGMPAFEAACAGVWFHGETGQRAGNHPSAEDLVGAIQDLPAFAAL
jgi:ADP-dependent NAD(P)H-hydrate dehydratase / NAD(P)H-hydrate epimerase